MSWCLDCGEDFREDDTGGYNPECTCGCGCCRSCHDAAEREDAEFWGADEEHDVHCRWWIIALAKRTCVRPTQGVPRPSICVSDLPDLGLAVRCVVP